MGSFEALENSSRAKKYNIATEEFVYPYRVIRGIPHPRSFEARYGGPRTTRTVSKQVVT